MQQPTTLAISLNTTFFRECISMEVDCFVSTSFVDLCFCTAQPLPVSKSTFDSSFLLAFLGAVGVEMVHCLDVWSQSNRGAVFSDWRSFWRFSDLAIVQLSVPTAQKPPVIRHCVTHHAAANDKDCCKVCDSITDDWWLLSSSV